MDPNAELYFVWSEGDIKGTIYRKVDDVPLYTATIESQHGTLLLYDTQACTTIASVSIENRIEFFVPSIPPQTFKEWLNITNGNGYGPIFP